VWSCVFWQVKIDWKAVLAELSDPHTSRDRFGRIWLDAIQTNLKMARVIYCCVIPNNSCVRLFGNCACVLIQAVSKQISHDASKFIILLPKPVHKLPMGELT
jgi:hypothetical protein